MGSKKGIIITAGILGAITAASFLVWIMPQSYDASFVASDFEVHLDGVQNIHKVIIEETDAQLEDLMVGKITADQYIQTAETSTIQINSQIISIVESSPSEDWQESYIAYMESLRKSNEYIRETIVYANMLKDGASTESLDQTLDATSQIKSEIEMLIGTSNDSRP